MAGPEQQGGTTVWGKVVNWALPVKPDTSGAPATSPAASHPVLASQQTAPVGAFHGASASAMPPPVDQQMSADLERAIFAQNGVSAYLQLVTLLKALEVTLPDEALRYRSAFAAAKAQGLDHERVLQALKSHVDTLAQQFNAFTTGADRRLKASTEAKEREIAALDQQMATKRQEAERLQAEIAKLTASRAGAESALQTERLSINDVKARFQAAHDALRQKLIDDQARVTRYSQGG